MKTQLVFGILVSLVGWSVSGCGGGSSGGSSSTTGSSESYQPQNLPGVYSVDLPQSLQPDAAGGAVRMGRIKARKQLHHSVRSTLNAGSTNYANQAQGYNELRNVVDQMMLQKSEISLRFLEADVIFDDVLSHCSGQSGECVIANGTLSFTVTEEIVNFIIESMGGEEMMDPMDLEYVQSMIGTTMPVPEIRYTALNGQGGLDHSLQLVEEGGYSTKLTWNSARTQVTVYFEYDDPAYGSGSDSFSYNDTDQVMIYRSVASSGGSSWNYTATIGADSAKAELSGVKFSVSMENAGEYGNFSMLIAGVADDEGGYAESTYSSDHIPLVASGSGISNVISGSNYVLAGASADCTTLDWIDVLGSVYYLDGSSLASYYYGPSAAASSVKVCSIEYGENGELLNGQLISNISFTPGTVVTDRYYYSEVFDATGELLKAGYKDTESDPYIYYLDSEEGAQYEEYYESESSSGEFLADVQVSVSGISGVSSDSEIILIRDGVVFNGEDWSEVIGEGRNDGSGFVFTYYGTEAEASSADVYQMGYDSSGNSVITLISGASVQVQ